MGNTSAWTATCVSLSTATWSPAPPEILLHGPISTQLCATEWTFRHPSKRPWGILTYMAELGFYSGPCFHLLLLPSNLYLHVTSSNSHQHLNKMERRESEPFSVLYWARSIFKERSFWLGPGFLTSSPTAFPRWGSTATKYSVLYTVCISCIRGLWNVCACQVCTQQLQSTTALGIIHYIQYTG